MIQKLGFYLQYPFVRNALIVGVFIALSSSLLGVTLVLKRFSYIGDGLSHVAFGAMSVAMVLQLTDNMIIVMPVTIVTAILLLRNGNNQKIKGDAAIAMLSVGSLAVGYMLLNIFSSSSNVSGDVCSTLFGSTSILTLTNTQVIVCLVLSFVVLLVYIFFFGQIFTVTFDEDFAKATGTKVEFFHLVLSIIIAITIVLAMNLAGSLLVSALIIFPAITAMRVFKNFKAVVICASVISVLCALIGMIGSILFSTPVGSTIVVANLLLFVVFSLFSRIKKKELIIIGSFCFVFLFAGCASTEGKSLGNQMKSVSEVVESQIQIEEEIKENKSEIEVPTGTEFEVGMKSEKDSVENSMDLTGDVIDLTQMGSDMVYATVYQLMVNPTEYIGKTIRVSGTYSKEYYEPTQTEYHYVLIKDALACCSQGMEFIGSGKAQYPQIDQTVVITGTFETYTEDSGSTSTTFCHLVNASIELVQEALPSPESGS